MSLVVSTGAKSGSLTLSGELSGHTGRDGGRGSVHVQKLQRFLLETIRACSQGGKGSKGTVP